MSAKLTYIIAYVDDMKKAVQFHQEAFGLSLKFQTPHWTEFDTGETTLALHPSSADHPAGTYQLGFRVADIEAFHQDMESKGYRFTMPPTEQFGAVIARFIDAKNVEYSVSGS